MTGPVASTRSPVAPPWTACFRTSSSETASVVSGATRTSSTPAGANTEVGRDDLDGDAHLVGAGVGEHERALAGPLRQPEQKVRVAGSAWAGSQSWVRVPAPSSS